MTKIENIIPQLMSIAFKRRDLLRLNFKYFRSNYKFSEMHTLDYIGKNTHPNVTGIATHLGMTRGAISKVIKKLIRNKHIKSYKIPDNKKEIYYELTPAGYSLFEKHAIIHQEFTDLDSEYFKQFDTETIKQFSDILHGYYDYLETKATTYGHIETTKTL